MIKINGYKIDTNALHKIVNAIFLFFTVFSIHFKGGVITPRILVMFFLLFSYLLHFKKPSTREILWMLSCFFVFAFTWFSVWLNASSAVQAKSAISPAFNFMIFVGIFPTLMMHRFSDTEDFCVSLFTATAVQSLIVIASALIPSVRNFLEDIQVMDYSRYNYRIIGLGLAGAGGSVYLMSGIAAGLILFLNKQSSIRSKLFLPMFILNFVAIALVGRSGFYCAILCIFSAFIIGSNQSSAKTIKIVFKTVCAAAVISVIAHWIISYFDVKTGVLKYTVGRLDEIFSDNRTFKILREWDEGLPELNFRSVFFGFGLIRGRTIDGIGLNHDGGYAQRYAAIGLIMAVYSYIAYFSRIKKECKDIKNRSTRRMIWVLLISLLILEYKEPFFYMLSYPFTILMMAMLLRRDSKKLRVNINSHQNQNSV